MAYQYITNFISSLNKNEVQLVLDHFKNSISASNQIQKDLKLFKLLITNNTPENKLCIELDCSPGALRVLKNRLLEKIFEALTFDKHITNTDVFNNYDTTLFKLKKKCWFIGFYIDP
jgi:hypothetical protein